MISAQLALLIRSRKVMQLQVVSGRTKLPDGSSGYAARFMG
jgi:hypothetical protein